MSCTPVFNAYPPHTRLYPIFLASAIGLSGSCFAAQLKLTEDLAKGVIMAYREGENQPILTQNAMSGFRPFLHPLLSPDGKTVMTELSPGHHPHQTGIYWGFTKLNGRDYFHNPGEKYWKRVGLETRVKSGESVSWSTSYHLLDADGKPVMLETQIWTLRENRQAFVLELEWRGEALTELTIARHPYGGFFVRMPWRQGMPGTITNSALQTGPAADGKKASWVNISLQLEGRSDPANFAIFDDKRNTGYPVPWRVDNQFGVGPSRSIEGDWTIAAGQTATVRHHLMAYTGNLDQNAILRLFDKP